MPFSGDGLRRTGSHHEIRASHHNDLNITVNRRDSQGYPEPDTPGRGPLVSPWMKALRKHMKTGSEKDKDPASPTEGLLIRGVLAYAGFVFFAALLSVWYFMSIFSKP
eukprot:CAMPEP_0118934122 /NCGR_PEP_ID=MMETSP1169-20130426/13653_1 /TAXON_ID=36882 /ORGANISM="Pyramimonas obovata, Strain CCMP722" /LENGTH=107 /DNA_ID=CAMNT_0006876993 /DNA_START=78 /DNA_END=401 /DNA_ORIENTATION=+